MSFTFLLAVLEATFAPQEIVVPRSTLHRRLLAEPSYQRLKRRAKQQRRRTRFVAKEPHI
jgi:hypothetical protein